MLSTDSTIFELLSSLFENCDNDCDTDGNQSTNPFLDLCSGLKYAIHTLAIMLIRKLLDQSLMQLYIASTIQYSFQALLAAYTMIPSSLQVVLLVILFFVYMPQIARALSPVISRLRSYKNYLFPQKTSKFDTNRQGARPAASPRAAQEIPQSPIRPPEIHEQKNILQSKVYCIVIGILSGKLAKNPPVGEHTPTSDAPLISPHKKKVEELCLQAIKEALIERLDPQSRQRDVDDIIDQLNETIESVVEVLRAGQERNNPGRKSNIPALGPKQYPLNKETVNGKEALGKMH